MMEQSGLAVTWSWGALQAMEPGVARRSRTGDRFKVGLMLIMLNNGTKLTPSLHWFPVLFYDKYVDGIDCLGLLRLGLHCLLYLVKNRITFCIELRKFAENFKISFLTFYLKLAIDSLSPQTLQSLLEPVLEVL